MRPSLRPQFPGFLLRGILLLLCLAFLAGCAGVPQTQVKDTAASVPAILLVVPESDTTITDSPTYRLSASAHPASSVTINGKALNLYPSGAVGGLLNLQAGENLFTLSASNGSGSPVTKSFLIVRTTPLATSRMDTLAIEDTLMEPSVETWLDEGDFLRVQFKGTPGCKATFLGAIPMREAPLSETRGVAGIYRGIYKVSAHDTLLARPIPFMLTDSLGRTVTAFSKGLVSFRAVEFPMVGITRRARPFLHFGLGSDRLGGAVFSVINPDIKLAITGKVGRQYRVALAEGREAWIDEWSVQLLPGGSFLPSSLTGSWSVYGDEKYDYVTVGLSERLPYSSFQESSPTRINVDVYGAVSNSNWITQQLTASEVKNVYYNQVGKDVFRLTIELQHKQMWGYDISYRGTSLVVRIRRQPGRLKLKALTFALDAGHGGDSDGAIGSTGSREKDINLAIVRQLRELLESKGARVVLTRSDDSAVRMDDRLKTAFDSGADMLISVHSNSIGNTTNPEVTKGVSTYYKHICYRPLSLAIYRRMLETGLAPFGNVGSFNFSLNSPTELPNALVEVAFMSNPEDEMRLMDGGFRKTVAEKIVEGIEDFLEECE